MEWINLLTIPEEIISALGWTVLHSTWEAGAIGIILALILSQSQGKSANWRYTLSLSALAFILIASVVTFFICYSIPGQSKETINQSTYLLEGHSEVSLAYLSEKQSWTFILTSFLDKHLYLIVSTWVLGMLLFAIKFIFGIGYIFHLKKYSQIIHDVSLREKVGNLIEKLQLGKVVSLGESALVKVPMVVGHLKPIILLPIGAMNCLSPQQVEAVLAHELAHIMRNDYVINILQSLVEVIFYFHPAVWWISSIIRQEREACCDDTALELCGNSLEYAKALVQLQELQTVTPAFGMSFSGRKNQFLFRIKRILNQTQSKSNTMEKLMATGILLAVIIALFIQATSPMNAGETEVLAINGENTPHCKSPQAVIQEYFPGLMAFESNANLQKDTIIPEPKQAPPAPEPPLPPTPPTPTEGNEPTPPAAPEPKLPPGLEGNFFSTASEMEVKTKTDDDGNTVIIISDGNEPVEIIVNKEGEKVFIDEKEVEIGENIIIERDDTNNHFFWYENPKQEGLNTFKYIRNGKDVPKDSLRMFFSTDENNNRFAEAFILAETAKAGIHNKVELETKKALLEARMAQIEAKKNELEARKNALSDEEIALRKEEVEKRSKEIEKLKKEVENFKERKFEHKFKTGVWSPQSDARIAFFSDCDDNSKGIAKVYSVEGGSENGQQKLEKAMIEDGLIKDGNNYSFSLDSSKLKVNGKKQSDQLHKKYLKLYEEFYGEKMNAGSQVQIQVNKN